MISRRMAWVAVPLVIALAGCGSPLDNQLQTGSANPIDTARPDERLESPEPDSTEAGSRQVPKRESKTTTETQPSPDTEAETKPKSKPETEAKGESKRSPDTKVESKAETKPKPQPDTQEPMAKGSPLDIAIFTVVGAPFAVNQAFIEGEIIRACGGTLCVIVKVEFAPGGPQSLTCGVAAIDQPNPTKVGDTITFTLGEPCEEDLAATETTPGGDTNQDGESAP